MFDYSTGNKSCTHSFHCSVQNLGFLCWELPSSVQHISGESAQWSCYTTQYHETHFSGLLWIWLCIWVFFICFRLEMSPYSPPKDGITVPCWSNSATPWNWKSTRVYFSGIVVSVAAFQFFMAWLTWTTTCCNHLEIMENKIQSPAGRRIEVWQPLW